MTAQAWLWVIAAGALMLAIYAGWADVRRNKRPNLENVGWVPWGLVQVLGGLCAVIAAALGFMSR